MAHKLNDQDRLWINAALRDISFYGTPEKGYADSGFWKFVQLVKTKDEHAVGDPVHPLDINKYTYLQVVWLHMLHMTRGLIPKSRQIRMSWAAAIFAVWFARSAPHRLVIFQSMKDEDAQLMVSRGKKDPVGGRMSLIENELPWWLKDYNIISGEGNRVGELVYTPTKQTDQGVMIPWYGSRIMAVPQGANQVRGKVVSLYMGDEAGLWDDFTETWGAVSPAVRSGKGNSKMFAFSSVYAGSQFNDAILEGCAENESGVDIEYTGIPEMRDIVEKMPGRSLPRGLRSFCTPSGMPVLEVHYASDPDKRPDTETGRAWLAAAAQDYIGGTASPDWQREMEINYSASGGSLVFPEAQNPLAKIWHRPLTMKDVRQMGLKLYAGYDYGARNPSAFIIWGQAPAGSPGPMWYAIDEIYEPCVNYVQHSSKIKSNKYMASKMVEKVICDPQLMAKDQQTESGKASMLELFRKKGLIMEPGRKGADLVMIQLLRLWWSDQDNPQLVVCSNCWNLAREIRLLKWQTLKGQAALSKSLVEKVMDKNNHAFDASAYMHDTRPRPPQIGQDGGRMGMTWADEEKRQRREDELEKYAAYRV